MDDRNGMNGDSEAAGTRRDRQRPLAELVAAGSDGTGKAGGIPELLHAIRTHMGMDVAFVSEFRDGKRVFQHVDAVGSAWPVEAGGADPLKESYCLRVVDGRLPELICDASTVPAAAELPVTAELPVGAHLSVPIRLSSGRVYGTFCCFSSTPDLTLNDRDLAMMRVFADLTAQRIEAKQEAEERDAIVVERVRTVLAGHGLSMVFQPIVALAYDRPAGYEALARFTAGPVRTPDVWFNEAAGVGYGTDLDLAAIDRALDHLPYLPDDAYLAINVTPATVTSGRLVPLFETVEAERIVLEITEHAIIDNYDDLVAALEPLRRRNLRISVDDAGAGYASLRHILRLRPDLIKLDMSLTRGIDSDPARRSLASAMVFFGRETGSTTVAEGVETAEELAMLRRIGVTHAQGYYLGRPGPLPARRRCMSEGLAGVSHEFPVQHQTQS